jgi:hypothetical protein
MQAASFDVSQRGLDVAEDQLHVSADGIVEGGTDPLKGNMHDLDLGHAEEQLGRQVRDAALPGFTSIGLSRGPASLADAETGENFAEQVIGSKFTSDAVESLLRLA